MAVNSFPLSLIDPVLGVSNPANKLIKVDFPEPDSPTMAILSPDLIIKSIDDNICKVPSEVTTDLPSPSVTIMLFDV
jgi:hypothetical protein